MKTNFGNMSDRQRKAIKAQEQRQNSFYLRMCEFITASNKVPLLKKDKKDID